jgi:hypothetical protein
MCAERCDHDDGPSCYALGQELERTARSSPDFEHAAQTYERGCSLGDAYACYAGGVMYLGWTGAERRIGVAAPMLRKACGKGLYDYACANGHMPSCSNLGLFLRSVDPFTDNDRSVRLLRRACEARYYLGCVNLAGAYESGLGVPRDVARARALLLSACDHGESAGCLNLGSVYEQGEGVPKDLARAASLYRLACDGGSPSACGFLASLVEAGKGTRKDRAEAVRLYRRACRGGMSLGCSELERLREPK